MSSARCVVPQLRRLDDSAEPASPPPRFAVRLHSSDPAAALVRSPVAVRCPVSPRSPRQHDCTCVGRLIADSPLLPCLHCPAASRSLLPVRRAPSPTPHRPRLPRRVREGHSPCVATVLALARFHAMIATIASHGGLQTPRWSHAPASAASVVDSWRSGLAEPIVARNNDRISERSAVQNPSSLLCGGLIPSNVHGLARSGRPCAHRFAAAAATRRSSSPASFPLLCCAPSCHFAGRAVGHSVTQRPLPTADSSSSRLPVGAHACGSSPS